MNGLDTHAERFIQGDPCGILRVTTQFKIGTAPRFRKRAEVLDQRGSDSLPAVRFVDADIVKQEHCARLQHGKLGLSDVIGSISKDYAVFAGKQELFLLHPPCKNRRLKGVFYRREDVRPPRKMHRMCLPRKRVDRLKI